MYFEGDRLWSGSGESESDVAVIHTPQGHYCNFTNLLVWQRVVWYNDSAVAEFKPAGAVLPSLRDALYLRAMA